MAPGQLFHTSPHLVIPKSLQGNPSPSPCIRKNVPDITLRKGFRDFLGPVVKSPSANAGDMGSIPGLGRSHKLWGKGSHWGLSVGQAGGLMESRASSSVVLTTFPCFLVIFSLWTRAQSGISHPRCNLLSPKKACPSYQPVLNMELQAISLHIVSLGFLSCETAISVPIADQYKDAKDHIQPTKAMPDAYYAPTKQWQLL